MSKKQFQTRNQKRAQAAYNCVSKILKDNDKTNYKNLAKKFPALVHTCGLTQAVAFVEAKEDQTGKKYLEHLSNIIDPIGCANLSEKSRKAPMVEYRHLSREVVEAATWLKRYSEALFGDE